MPTNSVWFGLVEWRLVCFIRCLLVEVTQGGHFVFIRAGGKLERLHQRFKDWRNGGGIHGAIPFKRASRQRRNNCRIWCAGRWGARRKAHTLRKGVARRTGVDSNESPNAKGYLRRRGGWRRETPAKSTCRQPRLVRIAAAIASARNPKLFASAIRGWRCAWQMLVAFPRRLMIADRRLLVLLLPLIICFS